MNPIFLAACLSFAGAPASDEPLARYRLTPGRVLTWQSDNCLKFGKGEVKNEQRDSTRFTASVVRANPDGSVRVLICAECRYFGTSGGKPMEETTRTHIAYADLFPDGRFEPNTTTESREPVTAILPRLPKDENEARNGWKTRMDEIELSSKALGSNRFEASSSGQSGGAALVPFTYKKTYSFDSAKGLVTLAEHRSTTSAVPNGESSGRTTLIGDTNLTPEALASLAADTERYVAAEQQYEAVSGSAWKSAPAIAKATLAKAGRDLESAGANIARPDLKKAIQEKMTKHESVSQLYVTQAENWAKRSGKPVPALKATDLQGKPIDLAELRGKVVVMDFWYRGCGWCIKAMPQVKQVAVDFAHQPVAVLGVSVDPTDQDALVVTQGLNLPYPTVRIRPELLEPFGIQGMPALLIIDKSGLVRDMHLGYSATLRESVAQIVNELLKEPAPDTKKLP